MSLYMYAIMLLLDDDFFALTTPKRRWMGFRVPFVPFLLASAL